MKQTAVEWLQFRFKRLKKINYMWINTYKSRFNGIHICDVVDIRIKNNYIKNIKIK